MFSPGQHQTPLHCEVALCVSNRRQVAFRVGLRQWGGVVFSFAKARPFPTKAGVVLHGRTDPGLRGIAFAGGGVSGFKTGKRGAGKRWDMENH